MFGELVSSARDFIGESGARTTTRHDNDLRLVVLFGIGSCDAVEKASQLFYCSVHSRRHNESETASLLLALFCTTLPALDQLIETKGSNKEGSVRTIQILIVFHHSKSDRITTV